MNFPKFWAKGTHQQFTCWRWSNTSLAEAAALAKESALRFALGWAVMITALASGAFLGLSCGVAPGPLLALLLAQTLRHGPREGCKIAMTPLVADAPIIVVALVVAAKLAVPMRLPGQRR